MLNKFHIPSYEEAVALVNRTGSLTFYEYVQYVDGYKISIFNYRLASYKDFVENKAYEMRGLVYVFNLDGTLYKSFRLLHKFFNLNQVAETQFELVKDLKITNITNKEDGSVISFIQLPNGKVCAKSKMSVMDNTQSLMAQEIYDTNPAIKAIVDYTLANDMVAIFELVSPFNRIVLKYTQTELILIRLRDNISGAYLPFDTLGDLLDGVKTPKVESYTTWEELMALVDVIEGIEGWVVTMETGQLIKLKTRWYVNLHNLYDYINREDYLLEMILDEKIDDILGELSEDDVETRALVDIVFERVTSYLEITNDKVSVLISEYHACNCDKKVFALKYLKSPYFGLACTVIGGEDKFKVIITHLKKKCYRLEEARFFVKTGGLKC